MSEQDGLIVAYSMDGRGGGQVLDWHGVRHWMLPNGFLWVHLNYSDPAAVDWLNKESGLSEVAVENLLAEEPRPRSVAGRDGLLVILRGVNLNPGAQLEDMVSIRVWIEERRVITTRHRRLRSVDDLRADIERGQGPGTTGEFLVTLAECVVDHVSDVVEQVDAKVDALEVQVLSLESHQLRPLIASVRRQSISLRRYLAPQRDAMNRLYLDQNQWLTELDRTRLREASDRVMRYIEDLDSARDRAAVTQEELASRLSEQMDKRMYVLSVVAAIFLPLGFLTGLLGINVGGIPGTEFKGSFLVVCILLGLLAGLLLWLFRKQKWL